mgnify:CR=1 FL=1
MNAVQGYICKRKRKGTVCPVATCSNTPFASTTHRICPGPRAEAMMTNSTCTALKKISLFCNLDRHALGLLGSKLVKQSFAAG